MKDALESVIRDALSEQPYFAEPLFGYADLYDPLFSEYKQIIGQHHMTPAEAFSHRYAELPQHGTVVVWVLPLVQGTIESNRQESRFPSKILGADSSFW